MQLWMQLGYKAKPYKLLSTYCNVCYVIMIRILIRCHWMLHFASSKNPFKKMCLNFPCAEGLNKDDVLCLSLIKTRVRERMICEYKIIACCTQYSPGIDLDCNVYPRTSTTIQILRFFLIFLDGKNHEKSLKIQMR